MIQNDPTNVLAAFEMLLEEMEDEIELINKVGSEAFLAADYDQVEAAKEHGLRLTALREQLAAVRRQWKALAADFDIEAVQDEKEKAARRDLGRLKRGMRTTEDVFRIPILGSLVELGGSARTRDVLNRVEEKMSGVLKEADYESLPSNPNISRWSNTAQWSRNTMVNEGLMRSDSAHGTWEISDAGKVYLDQASRVD